MITTSEILFPGFREDRHEYEQSRREWLGVFNAALEPAGDTDWQEWLRDPFCEGTPIFSRVDRRRKTGIVVNQILPSDDELEFRAHLDIFAPDSVVDLVEHVAITCTLSETSKRKAAKLINAYLGRRSPPNEIARLCETLTG
jgi:hypothetical protein